MKIRFVAAAALIAFSLTSLAVVSSAQSGATRPRRTVPVQPAPTPSANSDDATTTTTSANAPRRSPNTTGSTNRAAAAATSPGDTTRAFALLQQKQFDAARREALAAAGVDPKNSEAWKIAGFAAMNLKLYAEAAADLQRALDLQRAAAEEDDNTVDALGEAYVRTEKFDLALPLLVAATTRAAKAGAAAPPQPDAFLLYYRGVAEFRTGKVADAERTLTQAVKLNPKNSAALFYLGRIAFERQDDAAAIAALNRATLSDPRLADAWRLLTYSYLRRAAAATGAKSDADYLSAVQSGEGLVRAKSDEASNALLGQALVSAGQYARAATVLERASASPETQGQTLYLLGFSHSRSKNFPKAAAALERAAAKTPADVNVYRELGYVYSSLKQYAKALAAYEKGLEIAPDDADLKASAEQVRPFAK